MNIFEKIIKKEIPAYIIYEDDLVISFLDISQTTVGHTLVIPKKSFKDIFELDEITSSHIFKVSVKIANALKNVFSLSGINVLSNNGVIASQSVFHFHIHLIPRYEKDDITITLPNNYDENMKEEYKKRADLIKSALL